MALLATLVGDYGYWQGRYAQIQFHSYNERFTGSYPNLYYEFDVRAVIVPTNGGKWSIDANTTFAYGSVQQTYRISSYGNSGNSQWYYVGHHKKICGCARSFTFTDSCSVSGFPVLSGSGSIATSTIGLPDFSFTVSEIGQTYFVFNWQMNSNPYNIYTLYLVDPSGNRSSQLSGGSGQYKVTGLTENTPYAYFLKSWLATGSGSALSSKEINVTTLENYPDIVVTGITVSLESLDDTDTATFVMSTTDDAHVQTWHFQVEGMAQADETSNTHIETGLAKNKRTYVEGWVTDTLDRTSAKFRVSFNTTFTYMTVYVLDDDGQWRKGYSMVRLGGETYQLCKLYVLEGSTWKEAVPNEDIAN